MCGIFFSCSLYQCRQPSQNSLDYLGKRGPDETRKLTRVINANDGCQGLPWFLLAVSSVLSLRGDRVISQPLEDKKHQPDSFLSWNGEAWKYDGKPLPGSDVDFIFCELIKAAQPQRDDSLSEASSRELTLQAVITTISKITGPYAFVFYDGLNKRAFYGRDVLGRRSLLIRRPSDNSIEIASVCGEEKGQCWDEVEAGGLSVLDLVAKVPGAQGVAPATGEERILSSVHVPSEAQICPKVSLYTLVIGSARV